MLVLLGRPQNLPPEVCLDVHSHPVATQYQSLGLLARPPALAGPDAETSRPLCVSSGAQGLLVLNPTSVPPPGLLLLGASQKHEAPGAPGHRPPPSAPAPPRPPAPATTLPAAAARPPLRPMPPLGWRGLSKMKRHLCVNPQWLPVAGTMLPPCFARTPPHRALARAASPPSPSAHSLLSLGFRASRPSLPGKVPLTLQGSLLGGRFTELPPPPRAPLPRHSPAASPPGWVSSAAQARSRLALLCVRSAQRNCGASAVWGRVSNASFS